MPKSRYLLLIFSAALLMASCRSARVAVSPAAGEANARAYIDKYKDLAVSEMKRTGIPASITLAQGMIESNYGRSTLAREANNHFGIKCHNDWKGPTIRHHDDRRNECFRKYARPEDSFYDHSDFLVSGSRYAFLFDLSPTDYKGWARGLKKAGYATNPDYANMLIRKIEENNLSYFDSGYTARSGSDISVAATGSDSIKQKTGKNETAEWVNPDNAVLPARVARVMENNRIKYIIVKDGDSVESIENEFQLLKWELTRYNELEKGFTPVPGQILYLQPKRDKAEPGKETYVVADGDSMYLISQKFGVKLKKLYEYNRMQEGEEPAVGQKLWLRGMRPVNN
jgi:LysM repeat protein